LSGVPAPTVIFAKIAFDFALRLVFFAAAPFLLVNIASLFPVTGALVQVGFALGVFFAGEAVRRLAARSKLAARFLGNQLAFEEYYTQHRPRPFVYYVLYPLLFPYWLSVGEARREFLLFKGYTLASLALLFLSLLAQYLRAFPPELGLRDFLPIAGWTLLVETAVVLMFLMPIVTTVVHFHQERAPWRLAALLLVGFVSVCVAVVRIERRRDPIVSYATRMRVNMRTAARPREAAQAQVVALRAAWKALPKDDGTSEALPRRGLHQDEDIDSDGKIEGSVLDSAHEALHTFYKDDEAQAFDLWYTRKGKSATMVVYFEARRKHDPIWLAMSQTGATTHNDKQLPKGAFSAMWRATQ
jgi:hypothetical protein